MKRPLTWVLLLLSLGGTNATPNADGDGDGQSNLQEYLAGTNPNDANSALRITYAARDEMTPNWPTAASTIANPANRPNSTLSKRGRSM